jgi:hypothetical protein
MTDIIDITVHLFTHATPQIMMKVVNESLIHVNHQTSHHSWSSLAQDYEQARVENYGQNVRHPYIQVNL